MPDPLVIEPTFDMWRARARSMLSLEVPPETLAWSDTRAAPMLPLLAPPTEEPPTSPHRNKRSINVPRQFVDDARLVAHHREPDRWNLMYRMLWRLTLGGTPHLMQLSADRDVRRFTGMERAVRRDRHKCHAFVRFRAVKSDDGEMYVAFHRPDHFILPVAAPFFVERFRTMRWAILTPDESVTWDDHTLTFGPGAHPSDAPADDPLEDLWRGYYRSIFNPARIKVKAMKKELPVRHWRTLPEAQDIPELLRDAPARVADMAKKVAAQPTHEPGVLARLSVIESIADLRAEAQGCTACHLCEAATQTVFGEGPPDAPLVFVGEQPGDQEDRAGRPFVGPAGQLLNEVLHEIGLDRRLAYVTNTVKHFKFEQRGARRIHGTPTAREVNACFPWLSNELRLVKPRVLVALGATAARALFGNGFRITQSRGEVFASEHAPQCMATYHPSALLRIPDDTARAEARALFTDDLRTVQKLVA